MKTSHPIQASANAVIGTDADIAATYRYPFPPFPNGWFPVEISVRLAPGEIINKHVLGRNVVIYRSESGVASIIDPYCPHLGAHIGKGGKVVGERIRCPFHHWEFGAEGRCEHAFGAKRTPDASVLAYPTVEKNGNIFIWVDSQGRAPHWQIPDLEETASEDYYFVGYQEYSIKSHPQEMFENLSDFLHFRTVHRWAPVDFEWHCAYGEKASTLNFDVTNNSEGIQTTTNVDRMRITSFGPSYNFSRYFGSLRGLATLMFCPTTPGVMTSSILFWVHSSIDKDIARGWMQGYLQDYSLDIEILENKKYLSSPRMSDADGPIHKMRKWYSQWYE